MDLISRTKRKEIKYMFVQETGYLLRKVGGLNCTRRSFPVKRWMNKYMGLIIQFAKEHVRVDDRTATQCKKRRTLLLV